jgi:hypothetical protein
MARLRLKLYFKSPLFLLGLGIGIAGLLGALLCAFNLATLRISDSKMSRPIHESFVPGLRATGMSEEKISFFVSGGTFSSNEVAAFAPEQAEVLDAAQQATAGIVTQIQSALVVARRQSLIGLLACGGIFSFGVFVSRSGIRRLLLRSRISEPTLSNQNAPPAV